MNTSLPLLDLVEMGCVFPPGIELAKKLELPTEDAADQAKEVPAAQTIEGVEQVNLDLAEENLPDVVD